MACVPTMMSATPAERLRMPSPSCCATQPATATIGSWPLSAAISRSSPEPRVELLFRALAHAAGVDDDDVGVGGVVGRLEAGLFEQPAIRSESWTFIWQPNVSIRYFRAMSPCLPPRLRPARAGLSPFALSLSPPARAGRGWALPLLQHLTGRRPNAVGDAAPPSIRAISSTRAAASSRVTRVRVRPCSTCLSIWKWVSA